jgi:hypothetical protein
MEQVERCYAPIRSRSASADGLRWERWGVKRKWTLKGARWEEEEGEERAEREEGRARDTLGEMLLCCW